MAWFSNEEERQKKIELARKKLKKYREGGEAQKEEQTNNISMNPMYQNNQMGGGYVPPTDNRQQPPRDPWGNAGQNVPPSGNQFTGYGQQPDYMNSQPPQAFNNNAQNPQKFSEKIGGFFSKFINGNNSGNDFASGHNNNYNQGYDVGYQDNRFNSIQPLPQQFHMQNNPPPPISQQNFPPTQQASNFSNTQQSFPNTYHSGNNFQNTAPPPPTTSNLKNPINYPHEKEENNSFQFDNARPPPPPPPRSSFSKNSNNAPPNAPPTNDPAWAPSSIRSQQPPPPPPFSSPYPADNLNPPFSQNVAPESAESSNRNLYEQPLAYDPPSKQPPPSFPPKSSPTNTFNRINEPLNATSNNIIPPPPLSQQQTPPPPIDIGNDKSVNPITTREPTDIGNGPVAPSPKSNNDINYLNIISKLSNVTESIDALSSTVSRLESSLEYSNTPKYNGQVIDISCLSPNRKSKLLSLEKELKQHYQNATGNSLELFVKTQNQMQYDNPNADNCCFEFNADSLERLISLAVNLYKFSPNENYSVKEHNNDHNHQYQSDSSILSRPQNINSIDPVLHYQPENSFISRPPPPHSDPNSKPNNSSKYQQDNSFISHLSNESKLPTNSYDQHFDSIPKPDPQGLPEHKKVWDQRDANSPQSFFGSTTTSHPHRNTDNIHSRQNSNENGEDIVNDDDNPNNSQNMNSAIYENAYQRQRRTQLKEKLKFAQDRVEELNKNSQNYWPEQNTRTNENNDISKHNPANPDDLEPANDNSLL